MLDFENDPKEMKDLIAQLKEMLKHDEKEVLCKESATD